MSKQSFDDGGPAFPIPNDDRPGAYEAHPGMSLHDWFAGQAVGLCVASRPNDAEAINKVAQTAYAIADAMLAARTRRTEQEG